MKRCTGCGEVKPPTGFYLDGAIRRARCRRCELSRRQERRAAGLTQEHDRRRYHGNPVYRAQVAANTARWKARNPEKVRAQNAVAAAIERGELVRQPCEVCGKKAHAHHENYAEPLSVRWLCPLHHARQHVAEGRLDHLRTQGAHA